MDPQLALNERVVATAGNALGVCIIAEDGTILYMNDVAAHQLAFPGHGERSFNLGEELIPEDVKRKLDAEANAAFHVTASAGTVTVVASRQWWQGTRVTQLLITPEVRAVDRGVERIRALARVSKRLSATLLLEDTLAAILDEAVHNSPASGARILIRTSPEEPLQTLLTTGYSHDLPALWALMLSESQTLIEDVLAEEGKRQSVLAVPIHFQGALHGIIALFSQHGAPFSDGDIAFSQALSHHAAVAIGNAERFAELTARNDLLRRRTQQIEHFLESSRMFHSDRGLEEVYEELVYAIQEGVGYSVVLLGLTLQDSGAWRLQWATAAGLPLQQIETVRRQPMAWEAVAALMRPEFEVGGAYFVPGAVADPNTTLFPDFLEDLSRNHRPAGAGVAETEAARVSDLFFIPLRDSSARPLGLIMLAGPLGETQPDVNTARVLEIFANQAASAIENVQLFHSMRDYALQLQQLHNVSQQTLREPDFDQKLQFILDGLLIAGWGSVALAVHVDDTAEVHTVAAGASNEQELSMGQELRDGLWQERFANPTWQRYRRGNCFLIPNATRGAHQTQANVQLANDELLPLWRTGDVLYRPLYDRDQSLIGLICLDRPLSKRRPDENALQIIDLYAQFAISIAENQRFFRALQQRSEELQTLFETSRALARTLQQDGILETMGESMLRAVDAAAYGIYSLRREEKDALVLRNYRRIPGFDEDTFESHFQLDRLLLAQRVRATLQPVTALWQPRTDALAIRDGGDVPDVIYVAMFPLMLRGQLFGFIEVVALGARFSWTQAKLQLIGAIINQASSSLETAHLIEELDARVAARTQELAAESERSKALLRIATELNAYLDRDYVLHQTLALVNEAVAAEQGAILLVEGDRGRPTVRASFGLNSQAEQVSANPLHADADVLLGEIVRRDSAFILEGSEADVWLPSAADAPSRSLLAVPLRNENEITGALLLAHSAQKAFSADQLSLVEAAASQAATAIQNASLYALTTEQAMRLSQMMREAQVEVAKNRAILQSIADGVLVVAADGVIILANVPVADILGIPRPQLTGKSVHEFKGRYGAVVDEWVDTIEAWTEAKNTLEPHTSTMDQMEIGARIVSVHAAPVFASGSYLGTISIFRDITKEVEVDRMKSEFVSTVSHELRTPMTSIMGYADLMLLGAAGDLSPAQSRFLEVIKKNADRLKSLVDDLLDISRIETGKVDLALQLVDLGQLVADVVNVHLQGRIDHENRDLSVAIRTDPSLPLLTADADKITRVITNLVDNAVKYTPDGGEISVHTFAGDDFAGVTVRDTGVGIAPAEQERIFERFYRVTDDTIQDAPGTGLGLAIVRSLVEMHGGSITLESEPGVGSAFTFTLPLDRA